MAGRKGKEDDNKRTVIEIDYWKRGTIVSCPLIYYSFFGRWYRGKGNAVYAQSLKITLTVDQRRCQALFHTYLEISLMNSFSDIFPLPSLHIGNWFKRLCVQSCIVLSSSGSFFSFLLTLKCCNHKFQVRMRRLLFHKLKLEFVFVVKCV